ncbi:MAG: hypothetical protein B6I36_08060 [Desulfobacteraceae bacterium 4572_35.1]|nr:MAG: hypothetical protein B6I36_08060 [Desulfobacteraceae bacterium 4572_35.1]
MCIKTIYSNPQWNDILTNNNLRSFDQFWNLQLEAVDEGNIGRGKNGWSRVCIHTLESANGTPRRIIIKRQSNYRSRTATHPLRGIPTFVKEYAFIKRYEQLEIPAMKAVYCATRKHAGEQQAILVTEYLEDYQSLFDLLNETQLRNNPAQRQQWQKVLHSVAQLATNLHARNLEHRCLFPKHIFVPNQILQQKAQQITQWESCLIDLEKTRWKPWGDGHRVRDLTALARRTPQLSNRDRILFLRSYFGIEQLDTKAKKLWSQVAQRVNKKRNK